MREPVHVCGGHTTYKRTGEKLRRTRQLYRNDDATHRVVHEIARNQKSRTEFYCAYRKLHIPIAWWRAPSSLFFFNVADFKGIRTG